MNNLIKNLLIIIAMNAMVLAAIEKPDDRSRTDQMGSLSGDHPQLSVAANDGNQSPPPGDAPPPRRPAVVIVKAEAPQKKKAQRQDQE